MRDKETMLYVKCPSCYGTLKTRQVFNQGRQGELPIGSPCPLCDGGYMKWGTIGDVRQTLEKIDREKASEPAKP